MSEVFGEKLRKRRIEKALTLEGLADKIGSTKAYVWQLENKRPARPSGELLLKIASVLEVSPSYLIDDSSVEPNRSQVVDALARGLEGRKVSASDVDKLLRLADMILDDKANKGSK
ncbi:MULTISPECIES: helix-turn-helix domain-containing protein [Devosia]|uniref:helix-turn-helix domain-containing protein n=1 Tax=Devosia TaxID=46913 RepID=UPI000CE9736D|nr:MULTISPECIES: helix-turn-helix transcriptional regulator [Devosia]AVF03293.1 transcriptional regulator [Devosia sp. I507]